MDEDSSDPVSEASDLYEDADQSFIAALASGADDETLHTLAAHAAATAKAWERADVAAGPPAEGIQRYYDAPEVLATLWSDIADAYGRRTDRGS